MKRRSLVSGLFAVTVSGCLSLGSTDTDGDGVVDGNDAAPSDSRVHDYLEGDPPPKVTMEPVENAADSSTVDIRVTHEGGEPFTAANTDRLELATRGTAV